MEGYHIIRVSPVTTRVREGKHITKGGGQDQREVENMILYVPEQSLGWGGEGEEEKNIGGVQGIPIQ